MNTATMIVICILVVVIGAVFFSFIKRFTAKQTCCGTEKVRSQKKKLNKVAGKVLFHVDGMHCNNCKASIENKINGMDGLSAKVDLENKTLTVNYSPGTKVDTDMIVLLLGELGFSAFCRQ